MRNWQEYLLAEPLLRDLEQRYAKLKRFERQFTPETSHEHGFSAADLAHAKSAMMESIRVDATRIPGKVYYWLFPFYPGNFLQLVAALGSCDAMDQQRDDPESRETFYQFFRSVPLDIRLGLGTKLNQPELTQQAISIQNKIHAKRTQVKEHLDDHFAN
jgi:hypothetical protein